MKKLFTKLLFFLPLIVLVWLVEYSATALTVFNQVEKTIAAARLNGKNVAFSFDYDDRSMQRYVINTDKNKKDIVVLGSSRSAKIDKDFFSHQSFSNNNVTGAQLEDMLGMYQLYRANNSLPGTIILGLDPQLMEEPDSSYRWIALSKEFGQVSSGFPASRDPKVVFTYWRKRLQKMVSVPYLQFCLQKISRNVFFNSDHPSYYVTDNAEDFLPVVHSDGSISESLKIRSKSPETVVAEIKNSSDDCSAKLFNNFSKEKEFLFLNFLQTLKNDKVKVVFWLAPFHPAAYGRIVGSASCQRILETETYFRKVARDNAISVVGSYNPDIYNLSGEYFYDNIHPKRAAIEVIFKKDGLVK